MSHFNLSYLYTNIKIKYEDLEELYISAPVRRMVWQTILVVREIVKVMKNPPAKIFIEMARDTEGKTRKQERTVVRRNLKTFTEGVRKMTENGVKKLLIHRIRGSEVKNSISTTLRWEDACIRENRSN